MLLKLFKNGTGCVMNPPNLCIFEGSDMVMAVLLENLSNIGARPSLCSFQVTVLIKLDGWGQIS